MLGFPDGAVVKNPPAVQRRRRYWFDKWQPIPFPENPVDIGALWATVHGIARVRHY